MDTSPDQVYPSNELYELSIFDLREHDGEERYNRARAAWGEDGDAELLDLNHPILIVRPGGARRCK
jgi:hypothetical protein